MVLVLDRYCIDRYESILVDVPGGRPLSPYHPPLASYTTFLRDRHADALRWEREATAAPAVEQFPELPRWQAAGVRAYRATSRPGAVPSAYLTLASAREACEAAGKRLCSRAEWQRACRGADDEPFPNGDAYRQGTCNVFREDHPGRLLFGNMTIGMLDPRMNLVKAGGKPLLRPTGATPACVSRWGGDAIHDMVGNLDEWVDEPDGTFVGAFYSRSARDGCAHVTTTHGASYFDYSIGARCCLDTHNPL